MNLEQRDRKFLSGDKPPEDLEVDRTEGSFVFDSRGKKYIDFLAGWCAGNFGWSTDQVQRAVRRPQTPAYVYPYYLCKPWVHLAEITPREYRCPIACRGGRTEPSEGRIELRFALHRFGECLG